MVRNVVRSAGVTLALLVVAPAAALADERVPPQIATETAAATVDAVHLRNGGLFRGRVSEIVPGDHVSVILPGGETKRVPWAEVDRVIVSAPAIPPPPTSATPVSVPTGEPAMVGPRARVHVTSPRTVTLYRRPAGSTAWAVACTSPCGRELPVGDTYRVVGNGVAQSKEFNLQVGPGGFVDLVVDPPSVGGMVAGGLLAGGGAWGAYVGMLLAVIGAEQASRNCATYGSSTYYGGSCASDKSDGPKIRDAGLVTMGVSAGAMVLGVIVFLNSTKTDVNQRSGGPGAPSNDAFVRAPVWRTVASSAETATGAPAATFPVLFQKSF